MTSDPSSSSPPASRFLSRVGVMVGGGLIVALLISVSLQSKWNQAATAANLELATLQIAALEAALEAETTLSSASSETLSARSRGWDTSARALLFGQSSSDPTAPVAVVIWSDSPQSGQLVFLTDTALTASFSSMSGHVSSSAAGTSVPLSFTLTRSSQIVTVQATDRIDTPQKIVIKILPRDDQNPPIQWVGEFQR